MPSAVKLAIQEICRTPNPLIFDRRYLHVVIDGGDEILAREIARGQPWFRSVTALNVIDPGRPNAHILYTAAPDVVAFVRSNPAAFNEPIMPTAIFVALREVCELFSALHESQCPCIVAMDLEGNREALSDAGYRVERQKHGGVLLLVARVR